MDFVKKNLGLIGFALLCLVLSGLLVYTIVRSAKSASDYAKKVAEQEKFLQKVAGYDYALNEATLADARLQAQQAQDRFDKLRDFLALTYSLPDEAPPTQLECLRALKRQVQEMHTYLKKRVAESGDKAHAVYVGQNSTYFSFDDVALAETLPARRDVPVIMRSLAAVWDIVRLVGIAQVAELSAISRPLGLRSLDQDPLYNAIPFEIVLSGTLDQVQRFINLMHTQASYVFFLRSVELLGEDQAPMGSVAVLEQFGLGTGAGTGMRPTGPGMRGVDPRGGDPRMLRPGATTRRLPGARPGADARVRPGADARMGGMPMPGPTGPGGPGGMMPGGPAGMPGAPGMVGAMGMTGADEEPVSRALARTKSELLAFRRDAVLQAQLRFDLIEFKEPEADAAPDMAFGLDEPTASEYEE